MKSVKGCSRCATRTPPKCTCSPCWRKERWCCTQSEAFWHRSLFERASAAAWKTSIITRVTILAKRGKCRPRPSFSTISPCERGHSSSLETHREEERKEGIGAWQTRKRSAYMKRLIWALRLVKNCLAVKRFILLSRARWMSMIWRDHWMWQTKRTAKLPRPINSCFRHKLMSEDANWMNSTLVRSSWTNLARKVLLTWTRGRATSASSPISSSAALSRSKPVGKILIKEKITAIRSSFLIWPWVIRCGRKW